MHLATEILIPTPMIIPATIMSVLLLLLLGATCQTSDARVTAIYVFGDSTADVGNNNYLPGDASTKADYKHNGIDYPTGVPTGRFCNGYIGVDFLAQKMGFKESPPAALSVTAPLQELNGVNFASGGSGVFDTTGENVSLSMNTQIKFFESSVKRLKASMGERKAKIFLAKSMFIFSTANNDMFAFFAETGGLNQTLNRHFVSSLSAQFKRQLQKLYDLGARKFAIFGTGMVGCTPALRSLSSSGECVAVLNDLSRIYNKATRKMLWSLKLKLSGFKFSFANAHEITTHIAASAEQLGFKETKSACCGVGAWNGEAPCTPNTTYCANRDEYLMWDYAHPTQANYKIIADLAFDGWWSYAMPINFRLLALLD